MDALALLKQQVATANDLMTQVFAGVNQNQAGWRLEGSTANPSARRSCTRTSTRTG